MIKEPAGAIRRVFLLRQTAREVADAFSNWNIDRDPA